jgi:hypothetical protein
MSVLTMPCNGCGVDVFALGVGFLREIVRIFDV